jgi:ATP-dependent protease Clp ATPase subunit
MYDLPTFGDVSEVVINRAVVEGKKKAIIRRGRSDSRKANAA